MKRRSVEELREELKALMTEHIETLKKETFVRLTDEESYRHEELLQRIREVLADYLAALKDLARRSTSGTESKEKT